MSDYTFPHSPDRERAVCAALMADKTQIQKAIAELKKECFFTYGKIFAAQCALYAEGKPVDAYTVHERLNNGVLLSDLQIMANEGYGISISDHIPHLQESQLRRDGKELFTRAANAFHRPDLTAFSILESVEKKITSLKKMFVPPKIKDMNSMDILGMEFKEPLWVVPDTIPVGLTLLAGRPKIGKSWACLNIGIAVAEGGLALGKIEVDAAEVAYLALEDTLRRIQTRLKSCLCKANPPEKLSFYTEFPRLDTGGLEQMEQIIKQKPDLKLILVDTLGRIRPAATKRNEDLYMRDYQALSGMKALSDKYHIAIVVVHHLRKMTADDPLDQISGTTGLAGCADAVLILDRTRGEADAVLKITGRDVIENEIAMKFDMQTTSWQIMGDAREYSISSERRDILNVLKEADGPMTPTDIANVLGKESGALKRMLGKMCFERQVRKVGYGNYELCK